MNALDILKYGQQTVSQAVEGFTQPAAETAGACGDWSVKDIIAHLASYELVMADVLSAFAGERTTAYLDKFTAPGGQFNDTEVGMRRENTLAEVLDELNEAHARVMSLAGQIPAETFRQAGAIPWYGLEYALDDFIVYTSYGHKREHSAQIAAFRDVLSRADGGK